MSKTGFEIISPVVRTSGSSSFALYSRLYRPAARFRLDFSLRAPGRDDARHPALSGTVYLWRFTSPSKIKGQYIGTVGAEWTVVNP